MMKQLTTRYMMCALCLFSFCFVLAACGTSTGSDATSTPAAVATTAPTPTPVPPTPTPVPVAAATLTTVTGNGYTIGSPVGWTAKKNAMNTVSTLQISRSDGYLTSLIAETIASTNGVSTIGSIQGALSNLKTQSKNFQPKNIPATVTIGNTTWDQGAATADDPTTGTNSTIYVMSTKFPGNANKIISILYTAKSSEFDKVNAEDFQPMLLSFKFA